MFHYTIGMVLIFKEIPNNIQQSREKWSITVCPWLKKFKWPKHKDSVTSELAAPIQGEVHLQLPAYTSNSLHLLLCRNLSTILLAHGLIAAKGDWQRKHFRKLYHWNCWLPRIWNSVLSFWKLSTTNSQENASCCTARKGWSTITLKSLSATQ